MDQSNDTPKTPNMGSEYSLVENEITHIRRLNSEITVAYANLSRTGIALEQAKSQVEQLEQEVKIRQTTIETTIAKANGWADAVAMGRGDDKPVGFAVDFQNNRIVRNPDANMG